MRNKLIQTLIEKRSQGSDTIRKIIDNSNKNAASAIRQSASSINRQHRRRPQAQAQAQAQRRQQLRGVYRGNYFRIQLPATNYLPPIQPLTAPAVAPSQAVEAIVSSATKSKNNKKSNSSDGGGDNNNDNTNNNKNNNKSYSQYFQDWILKNWSTVIFNVGSLCTLAAFTRSDILELRTLSATGTTCTALFRAMSMMQGKGDMFSLLWPVIFTSVNGYKISEILDERHSEVHLNEEQERIFVEHFMVHGTTPKQFEKLRNKAEILTLKKGDPILVKDRSVMDSIYLVVEGSTSASILGRHLTSMSTNANNGGGEAYNSNRFDGTAKLGGDSGVWIGEMTFLDKLYQEEKEKVAKNKRTTSKTKQPNATATTANNANENNKDNAIDEVIPVSSSSSSSTTTTKNKANSSAGVASSASASAPLPVPHKKIMPHTAMYTIVANEDCTVWKWSDEDMAGLFKSSPVRTVQYSIYIYQFEQLEYTHVY